MAKNPLEIEKQLNLVYENRKKIKEEISSIDEKINDLKNSEVKADNTINTLLGEKNKKLDKVKKIEEFLEKRESEKESFRKGESKWMDEKEKHLDLSKSLLTNQDTVIENINKKQQRYLKSVQHVNEVKKQQNKLATFASDVADENTDQSRKTLEIIESSVTQKQELTGLYNQIAEQSEKVGSNEFQTIDVIERKKDINQKIYEVEQNRAIIGDERADTLVKDLKANRKLVSGLKEAHDVMKKEDALLKMQNEKFAGMTDKVFGFVEGLPGGDMLSNVFNFDGLKESSNELFGEVMRGNFKGAMGSAKDLGGGLMDAFKLGKMGAMSFGAQLALATAGVTALIAGIMAAGKWLMDLNQHQADYAKDLGVSVDDAIHLEHTYAEIAHQSGDIAINTDKLKKLGAELQGVMGGVVVENSKFLTDIQSAKESFGLTTEEASKLSETALRLGTDMEGITNEVTAASMAMEEQLGVSINTRDLMKDIAEIPPGITASFKGSVTELAVANQKAKMLGTSLEKVQSMGEQMLDIESSLQTEMEARVLTGRKINLDKARQLALEGDTVGLQDEILKQMGGMEKFNNLNAMGQKKMAEAFGLSKDEMSDMLTKAEQRKNLGFDLNALSAEKIDLEMKAAKENGKRFSEEQIAAIKKRKQELRAKSLMETIQDIWTKIKDAVAKTVEGPMGGMVNKIQEFLADGDAVNDLISTIGSVFSTVYDVVSGIVTTLFTFWDVGSSLLKGFLTPFFETWKAIKTAVSPLVDMISGMFGSANEEGEETLGIMDTISILLEGIGKIITTVLVKPLTYIVGMFEFVSKLIQGDIEGAFESIGKMIWDMFIAPVEIVADMIDQIFGTDIMGFIKDIKGAFMGFFGSIFSNDGFSGVLDIVKEIGGYVWDFIVAPFDLIVGIATGIYEMLTGDFMGGLEKVGASIKDYFLAPFNLVKGIIETVIAKVSEALDVVGKVGSAISDGLSSVGKFFGLGGGDEEEKGIQGAATGGKVKKEGLTVVGEEGPEVVRLPQSSEIIPNLDTNAVIDGLNQIISALTSFTSVNVDSEEPSSVSVSQKSVKRETVGVDTETKSMTDIAKSSISSANPFSSEGGGKGSKEQDVLGQMVGYLQQIASVTSQPVVIKVGEKTIREMDTNLTMAKNRQIGLDKTYGST